MAKDPIWNFDTLPDKGSTTQSSSAPSGWNFDNLPDKGRPEGTAWFNRPFESEEDEELERLRLEEEERKRREEAQRLAEEERKRQEEERKRREEEMQRLLAAERQRQEEEMRARARAQHQQEAPPPQRAPDISSLLRFEPAPSHERPAAPTPPPPPPAPTTFTQEAFEPTRTGQPPLRPRPGPESLRDLLLPTEPPALRFPPQADRPDLDALRKIPLPTEADDEARFQKWYGDWAKRYHMNPDPDSPDQHYDYRAAFRKGVKPPDVSRGEHWPSDDKDEGHPNLIVGGFHTKTGERVPGTARAKDAAELESLGWAHEDALRLAATPEPAAVGVDPKSIPLSVRPASIGADPTKAGPIGFFEYLGSLVEREPVFGVPILSKEGEQYTPFAGIAVIGANAYDVVRAARRVENNTATAADHRIIEEHRANEAELQRRGMSWGGTVAKLVADQPAFWAEFAVGGPAFKAGRIAVEKLGEYAITKAIKEMVERAVTKVASRKVAEFATKAAAKTVATTVGSAAQELTMPQRVVTDAIQKQVPTEQQFKDHLKDWNDDFLPALVRAIPNQFVEIFTEHVGEYLPGKGAIGKVMGSVAEKIPLPRLKALIAAAWLKLKPNATMSDFLDKVASKTGYDGLLNEVGEERIGELMKYMMPFLGEPTPAMIRTVTGEKTSPEQTSPRWDAAKEFAYQLSTEFAGFAVPPFGRAILERGAGMIDRATETPQAQLDRLTKESMEEIEKFNATTPDQRQAAPARNVSAPTVRPRPPGTAPTSAPVEITRQMEVELQERGYDDSVIRTLTPAQAHTILSEPEPPAPEAPAAMRPPEVISQLQPWETTQDEHRLHPNAVDVPHDSILALDYEAIQNASFEERSKHELQALAQVLDVSMRGTKEQLVDRIKTRSALLQTLEGVSPEQLRERSRTELQDIHEQLGGGRPNLDRYALGSAILRRLAEQRQAGLEAIADVKHQMAVRQALTEGQAVPPEVMQAYPNLQNAHARIQAQRDAIGRGDTAYVDPTNGARMVRQWDGSWRGFTTTGQVNARIQHLTKAISQLKPDNPSHVERRTQMVAEQAVLFKQFEQLVQQEEREEAARVTEATPAATPPTVTEEEVPSAAEVGEEPSRGEPEHPGVDAERGPAAETGGGDRVVEGEGARPPGEAEAEAPVAPAIRVLAIDTATGRSREVERDVELGRKEVLVEYVEGGFKQLRKGDQVTPDGLARVKRKDWTLPEEQETPPPAAETEAPAGETPVGAVNYNAERHSVEVKYPTSPGEAITDALHHAGFTFNRQEKVWYRHIEAPKPTPPNRKAFVADQVAGVQALIDSWTTPAAETPPAAPPKVEAPPAAPPKTAPPKKRMSELTPEELDALAEEMGGEGPAAPGAAPPAAAPPPAVAPPTKRQGPPRTRPPAPPKTEVTGPPATPTAPPVAAPPAAGPPAPAASADAAAEERKAARAALVAKMRALQTGGGEPQLSRTQPERRRARREYARVVKTASLERALQTAGAERFKNGRAFRLRLQEQVQAAAKEAGVSLDPSTPEGHRYLVTVALNDAVFALSMQPDAVGWYDTKVHQAMAVLTLIHPELATNPRAAFAFKWALAATSQGLKTPRNFEIAEAAYSAFKKTGQMPTDVGEGKYAPSINLNMALYNELAESWGPELLEKFAATKLTNREIQDLTGKGVGGEHQDTVLRGAGIIGAKIGGGFLSNLSGFFDELTMDVWQTRTWNRWLGTLINDNSATLPAKRRELLINVHFMLEHAPEAAKAFGELVGVPLDKVRGPKSLDRLAQAIDTVSEKPENRAQMNQTLYGNKLRLVGNALWDQIDGQQDDPRNGTERNQMRAVFGEVLEALQGAGYERLTMADLQAVYWLAEQSLHKFAPSAKKTAQRYTKFNAPDYAVAARKLAAKLEVPEADVERAIAGAANVSLRPGETERGRRRDTQAAGDVDARAAGREQGPRGALTEQERATLRTRRVGPPRQQAVAEPQFSRALPAGTFYSALDRAIDKKMPQRASPAQVLAIVENPQSGVRAAEVAATGLKEWLAEQSGMVTKEQVREFLAANQLEVREKVLEHYGPADVDTDLEIDAIRMQGYDVTSDGYADDEPYLVYGAPGRDSWTVFTREGNSVDTDDHWHSPGDPVEWDSATGRITDMANQFVPNAVREAFTAMKAKLAAGESAEPQHPSYVEPGGTNYREGLIILPEPQAVRAAMDKAHERHSTAVEVLNAAARAARSGTIDEQTAWWDSPKATAMQAEIDAARTAVRRLEEQRARRRFEGGHYNEDNVGEDNVLFHIRLNDRIDDQGRKVLFVEEIQSDWHQQGRKYGYDVPSGTIQGHDREWWDQRVRELGRDHNNLLHDNSIRTPDKGKTWRLVSIDGEWDEHPYPTWEAAYSASLPAKLRTDAYHRARENRDRLSRKSKTVPDAPFKTTWEELAFKRILRYAADGGYDVIAWTTGEQQAKRYSLASAMDRVAWGPPVLEKEVPEQKASFRPGWASFDTRIGPRPNIFNKPWQVVELSLKSGGTLKIDVDRKGIVTQIHGGSDRMNEQYLGEPLADMLGKDAATKIQAAHTGELTGEDLKLGGHGMHGFYDLMLPNILNKYAKPWGGRVGTVTMTTQNLPAIPATREGDRYEPIGADYAAEIITHNGRDALEDIFVGDADARVGLLEFAQEEGFPDYDDERFTDEGPRDPRTGWPMTYGDAVVDWLREHGHAGHLWFDNREPQPAQPAMPGRTETMTTHGFAIPDAMRAAVQKGQPLFAQAGPAQTGVRRQGYAGRRRETLQEAYNTVPIRRMEGRSVAVYDTGQRMSPDEINDLFSPAMEHLTNTAMTQLEMVLETLFEGRSRVNRIGVVLDDGIHGVYWPSQASPSATILLNLLELLRREQYDLDGNVIGPVPSTPREAAAVAWETITHEATHEEVDGHEEDFNEAWTNNLRKIGAQRELDALAALESAYADPAQPDRFHPEITRALSRYTASRGRPAVTGDPFSSAFSSETRPPDAGAVEGRPPEGARPDRGGTPAAAVSKEQILNALKLLQLFDADGITDFPTVVREFRDLYGPGWEQLAFVLEKAWLRFHGETVSVAEVVQSAQTGGKESTDVEAEGPDADVRGDRPGQLPESGEPTLIDVRDDGEDVLGTLPPAAGEGSAEGGGRGQAGAGDTEGGVAPGVSDDAVAGAESEAGPHAGGGVDPDRALSVSGTQDHPGGQPLDYVLDAATIATIIKRGPMERARDNLAAIKLIKQIREENRHATHDEQVVLAKYVGWGSSDIADFVGETMRPKWTKTEKALWQEIQAATTKEERLALQDSSPFAHFTYDLYRPIWQALERAGFTGGKVLEPSVGTGHAFGFMTPDVRVNSILNAVELEPLTAAIAQALYPSARVQATGYERSRIARNTQDIIIGNPPFHETGVTDPSLKPFLTAKIHNYFFAKALEHVRPGGLIVFITTRRTMDGPEASGVRRYLMEQAEFVGSVRLPNTAFDKSAKTKVVTDLIVLRKLKVGEKATNAAAFIESPRNDDLSTTKRQYNKRTQEYEEVDDVVVYRSSWYAQHPELILGTESMEGQMYREGEYTVTGTVPDLPAALSKALATILPPGSYTPVSEDLDSAPPPMVEGEFKVGEFRIVDGKVLQATKDGTLIDATPTRKDKATGTRVTDTKAVARITGMVQIRDALRLAVRTMQSATSTTEDVEAAQEVLQTAYDAFIDEFDSNLNSDINKRLFRSDPEANNLLGLETLKFTTTLTTNKKGQKILRVRSEVVDHADIFTKRTINAPVEITKADTPQEALMASLGTRTRIDWGYMAQLTGEAPDTLKHHLKADGQVFEQPDGAWVLRDEYLSGDVVTKLEDAHAAAEQEPERFANNVAALAAIQPVPKTPDEITPTFGAHWIAPEFVQRFLADELGVDVSSELGDISTIGTETYTRWTLQWKDEAIAAGVQHELAVQYGPRGAQETYTFTDLVNDALNLNMPSLGYWLGRGDDAEWIKDPVGTTAARANIESIRERWLTWYFAHPDAQQAITDTFNERYNRTVKREFDGSHMANIVDWNDDAKTGTRTASFPGLALEFPMYPHQLRAVWRILTSGNTLLAHEVGAGKTFEMIVAAMEMRRTGRARKPLITVPTHLLAQWRQTITQAYPTAKVLAFEEKDLSKNKRQQAMARIAYGDWDIVLVPHSSFQLLKVSNARVIRVMQQWLDELMDVEMAAIADLGGGHINVRKIAAVRKRIQEKVRRKIDAMNQGADNGLNWEDLGVDALMVDEAHVFKNLFMFTKIANLRGLSRSESDRALDLYVKVQEINEQSHYRNLVLATATPVMNSIAELFTMQRYLQPQTLEVQGLESFDNWYATFGRAIPTIEPRPDGVHQEVMRLMQFQNLDLLYRTMSSMMDYVGWGDMPYLKLPTMVDGGVQTIETPPHPMYPLLKDWFAERLAAIRANPPHVKPDGTYVAPIRFHPVTKQPMMNPDGTFRLDNILTVMTDAKLAAIDARLVLGDYAKDFPESRMQVAANLYKKVYEQEQDKKGVQLIWLDVGTPKTVEPLEFLAGAVVEDTTEGAALGVEDEGLKAPEGEEEEEDTASAAEGDNANGSFNMYAALKQELIKRGIPSKEIAFMHQARNGAERLALFDALREGKVRILIASTDKGGVGMNVQNLLYHGSHFDAPRAMRPGDIRQRDGRYIRTGNTYREVLISRFVTKGTTDQWLYGLLGQKASFITQFMRGEVSEYKDTDPSIMLTDDSIGIAQILSTGDPRGVELTTLRASLNRLKAQAEASGRAQGKAKSDVVLAEQKKKNAEADLAVVRQWVDGSYTPLKGEAFTIDIGGTTYTDREEANKRLLAVVKEVGDNRVTDAVEVAKMGGLVVRANYAEYSKAAATDAVFVRLDQSPLGGHDAVVATLDLARPDTEKAKIPFGQGRDVISSLTRAYAAIPDEITKLEQEIKEATDVYERGTKLLEKTSDATVKLRATNERIAQLEEELRAEGVARDVVLHQEHKDREAERDRQIKEAEANAEQERKDRATAAAAAAEAADEADDGESAMPRGEAADEADEADEEEGDESAIPPPLRRAGAGATTAAGGTSAGLSAREMRHIRPDQIAKRLAKALGNIPIAVGKVRGNLGLFKHVGTVRTQIAGDLGTLLHELAHALDVLIMDWAPTHKRGVVSTELKDVGKTTSLPSYNALKQRREGVAEYVRRWIMEPPGAPGNVMAQAPEFTVIFENFIQSHTPVAEAFADAKASVQELLALTPGEQFDVMVDFGDGHLPEAVERTSDWMLGTFEDPRTGWDRMVSAFSDDKHRLWQMERSLKKGDIDPGESVYWLARLLPGAARRAEGFVKFKIRDAAGKVLGPGLEEAFEGRWKHYREIVHYVVALRAARARKRGLETPFSPAMIREKLLLGQTPEVAAGAQSLAETGDAFLEYLVSEGFLTPEMQARWKTAWGDTYIPFKHIKERIANAGSAAPRTGPRRPRFMQRFRGSQVALADPIVTYIENIHIGTAAALENKFLRELIALGDQEGRPDRPGRPGVAPGGPYLEVLDEPKIPITFSLSRIKDDILDEMQKAGVDINDPAIQDPKFLASLATVWVPQKYVDPRTGKRYISAMMHDGSRKWAMVHDHGLWELLNSYGAQTTNTLFKVLRPFASMKRATATLNIPWMLRNLMRDFGNAVFYSPGTYTPMSTIRGFKSVFAEDEHWQLYLHSLAGQSTYNAQDRDVFKRQLQHLSPNKLRRFLSMKVFHPFDTLALLREFSEHMTRVGGTRIQYEAEKNSPQGLTEAGMRRIGIVGREITQDFNKIGSKVREVNGVTAFLAARIGGITRAAEEAKAHPGRLVLRVIPYMAFAIALWWMNKDDDEYDALDSNEKRTHHHIRVPDSLRALGWGPYVLLPRLFEFGDLANIIEGYLDWTVKNDPQAAERIGLGFETHKDRLGWGLDYHTAMDLVLALAPDLFVPPMEVAANYDTFLERQINSPWDTGLDNNLQYNRWTSETAKALGGVLDWPPWSIDHLLKGYFTGVYRGVTAFATDPLLTLGDERPPVPERVGGMPSAIGGVVEEFRRAFYRGEAVGTADLDEFFQQLTHLEGAAASVRRIRKEGDKAAAKERAAQDGLHISFEGGQVVVINARLRSLRKTKQDIAEMRDDMAAIYRNKTQTPQEKRAALNKLVEQMVNKARKSLGKPALVRTQLRLPAVNE